MKCATSLVAIATVIAITQASPVTAATTAAATTTAAVQTDPEPAPAANEGEVVVTGTRRPGRTATNSASPIDVIGAEELQSQPAANMLDIVRNVVPSFFVPQNTISDASTFVRPPSLRGLGADQILVMINGKRYNRAALVQVYSGADTALSYGSQGSDIGNIPAISIGNLQVLRDGATAQYGSDAIGGVINYQLRKTPGFEVIGQYGQTYEGDGERRQIAGYAGFEFAERGYFALSGEYYKEDGTSRGATRPVALALAAQQPGVVDRIPNYPGPAQIWGTSPGHGYKSFLNAGYEFSDAFRVYAVGNYSSSKANQSFNYRSPITATGLPVDDGSGTPATRSPGANGAFNTIYTTACPTGNATCPTGGFVRNGGTTFNFTSIYPGGFTPRFIGKVEQIYGTGGVAGTLESGFAYDVSVTGARNELALSMTDSLSQSFGPQSQTDFFFGKLIQRELNANLDLTYPLEVGFASPITLSGGAEYRREQYETTVGDLQSYAAGPYARQPLYDLVSPGVYTPALNGTTQIVATQSPAASGYGGVSPTFAGKNTQKSWGVYAGAEADISSSVTAGIAGRYEDYQTFGGKFVGKFNTIWHATDITSLRFTAGTGFHAPSPGQNNTQILTTNFLGGTQVQTGTYPVTSDIAKFYGATSLKPEKSVNFGAGIVIDPKNGFTLTIDGYTIKVKDRIGISQNFTVTAANIAALPSLASVGVGGVVNYFTNGFDTRTSGIDVVSSYRTRVFDGALNLTLAYNYNKSKVTDFNPAVINAQQRYNISNLPPKHRGNLSANWQYGDFTLNVRENFYSSWSNSLEYNLVAPSPNSATAAVAPPSQKFGAKFLTDLDVSYTFMDRFTLTVGANNLFDVYPDKIKASAVNPIYLSTNSLADGQIYPRSGGPFGINGGLWYVRVRVKY